jgi:hypothetical protein
MLCRPPELPLSATADRCRSPPLQPCRRHLLLLAAPMRRLQAGRRSSSSPLAFFRALHVALPLPSSAQPPPRLSSAASSSYCSPCPPLILKHVPGCSLTSSIPSCARCCLLLPLLDYFRRTSAARPSCHLAVTVVSTPAAYKALSFLAPALPKLTVVLLHHFISAEQGRSLGSAIVAHSSSPASSTHRGQPPSACPCSN